MRATRWRLLIERMAVAYYATRSFLQAIQTVFFKSVDVGEVRVLGGALGEVRVRVPWRNLRSESMVVTVDKVWLLLAPQPLGSAGTPRRRRPAPSRLMSLLLPLRPRPCFLHLPPPRVAECCSSSSSTLVGLLVVEVGPCAPHPTSGIELRVSQLCSALAL